MWERDVSCRESSGSLRSSYIKQVRYKEMQNIEYPLVLHLHVCLHCVPVDIAGVEDCAGQCIACGLTG